MIAASSYWLAWQFSGFTNFVKSGKRLFACPSEQSIDSPSLVTMSTSEPWDISFLKNLEVWLQIVAEAAHLPLGPCDVGSQPLPSLEGWTLHQQVEARNVWTRHASVWKLRDNARLCAFISYGSISQSEIETFWCRRISCSDNLEVRRSGWSCEMIM